MLLCYNILPVSTTTCLNTCQNKWQNWISVVYSRFLWLLARGRAKWKKTFSGSQQRTYKTQFIQFLIGRIHTVTSLNLSILKTIVWLEEKKHWYSIYFTLFQLEIRFRDYCRDLNQHWQGDLSKHNISNDNTDFVAIVPCTITATPIF